jgi:diguanylate cyclase (GGDEF)-like protein
VTTSGIYNEAGEFVGLLGVTRDISERKQAEERITHLAQHDSLTDLPNRALFTDRLQQALKCAEREGERRALMFMDLDRFKPVNDTYGHAVGDQLLQEAALRMRKCIRASDTVGRIGGDEFVVLLPKLAGERVAQQVAEKLRSALAEPFVLAGHSLNISSSIGIAIYPDHAQNERELSHCADVAMYDAKQKGRNTVVVFHEELRERPHPRELPAQAGAEER